MDTDKPFVFDPCAFVSIRGESFFGSLLEVSRNRIWLVSLYSYGSFRCIKKTLHIDEATLRDAKKACGAVTDTETVRLGLEALIRHAAYERLRKLRGSDADARDVPRRQPETRKPRTVA